MAMSPLTTVRLRRNSETEELSQTSASRLGGIGTLVILLLRVSLTDAVPPKCAGGM